MEIKEEKRGDIRIIGLCGRLDAQTSPTAEKRLMGFSDLSEQKLVFDLSELTFVSSGGLALLLKVAKSVQKANGKLALAGLSDHIHEVFEIAGFTSIFSIFPTCKDAVARLQGGIPCADNPPGGSAGP